MIDTVKMWQDVLVEIENSISKANFSTWFKDTSIAGEEDGIIYLCVPNSFTQEWLKKKFHNDILRILKQTDGCICGLEYVITGKDIIQGESSPLITYDFIIKKFEKLHGSVANVSGKVGLLDTRVINICSKLENLAIQIEYLRKGLQQELSK